MLQDQHTDLLELYQEFRVSLPRETMEELRGKSFVAEYSSEHGWRILRSDDDEEQLATWLEQSNVDLANIVLDQVPGESVVGGAAC